MHPSHAIRSATPGLAASLLLALAAMGCAVHGPGYYDPGLAVRLPARSAVHGAVYHHHGVALVYNGAWQGYAVRGHRDHYYRAGYFYRWHGGAWQRAPHLRGPWVRAEGRGLPRHVRPRVDPRAERAPRRAVEERRGQDVREHREDRRERAHAVERQRDRDRVLRERQQRRREPQRVRVERRDGRRGARAEDGDDPRGVPRDRDRARRGRR